MWTNNKSQKLGAGGAVVQGVQHLPSKALSLTPSIAKKKRKERKKNQVRVSDRQMSRLKIGKILVFSPRHFCSSILLHICAYLDSS
jgi:DNA-binding Xre family transcriptional regulator